MKFINLHEAILNSMSEAVYVVDRDMDILYSNPAAERLTGFSPQESVGQVCRDIFCRRSAPAAKRSAMTRGTGTPSSPTSPSIPMMSS